MTHEPGAGRLSAEAALTAATRVGPHGARWEKWAKAWKTGEVLKDDVYADASLESWTAGTDSAVAAAYAVCAARADWRPLLAQSYASATEDYAARAEGQSGLFG